MTLVTGDGNGEGEVMGSGHFQRRRGGGGEAAPRCRRWTTQRRAVRWSGRSKMTKGNWVGRSNGRLGRTAD
jgi:hypothetical protein